MGIQSTIELSRDDAEKKLVEILLAKERHKIEFEVKKFTNKYIENIIEEDFYNYEIIE